MATWLDYIVPGLRERDWNVTLGLVAGRFHDVDAYLSAHPDGQVLRIPSTTGTCEGRVRQLVYAIYSARPDIVVAVNIADVPAAVQRLRAKSAWSPRLAVALHGLQSDLVGSIESCVGVLDAVVCANRLICEMVAKATSIGADRIYYAPCGVDRNVVAGRVQRDSEGKLRIAYVGRMERAEKRIGDIVAIVAELDRRGVAYELLVAGDGPDDDWLKARLADAVERGRVQLLGALVGSDLAKQVYDRADAILITSPCESGPLVAWEAMAHGVIVVSSAYIGSALEGSLKSDENCLMFPVGEAITAVDCLERLRDPKLCTRLREGGFALVAERYSTIGSIGQWDSTLKEIAARAPMPPARQSTALRPPHAGRLDRLVGRQAAETIRELLSLRYDHCEAGGEWPHAKLCSPVDEDKFWQLARSLDRRPSS